MNKNFIDMIVSVLEYTGYPASDVTIIAGQDVYHNIHKFNEDGIITGSHIIGPGMNRDIIYINDKHGNAIRIIADGEITRRAKLTYNDKGLLIRDEGMEYSDDGKPIYDKTEMQYDIHGRLIRLIIYATDVMSGNEIEFNRADVLYQEEGNTSLIHSIHVCHLREETCDAVFKWDDNDEPVSMTIGDKVFKFTDPEMPTLASYKVKEFTIKREGFTNIYGIKLPNKK